MYIYQEKGDPEAVDESQKQEEYSRESEWKVWIWEYVEEGEERAKWGKGNLEITWMEQSWLGWFSSSRNRRIPWRWRRWNRRRGFRTTRTTITTTTFGLTILHQPLKL